VSVAAGKKSSMKRSIPLTAVFCAALLLSVARGRAQDLYVGSNAANVTSNFTSGTNLFNNTYVGYTTNATNNLLNVSGAGTVLTNTNALIVGFDGRGNSLIVSNGGKIGGGRSPARARSPLRHRCGKRFGKTKHEKFFDFSPPSVGAAGPAARTRRKEMQRSGCLATGLYRPGIFVEPKSFWGWV
jgi:T5SS/PEP-CTERM-associated repeat protein